MPLLLLWHPKRASGATIASGAWSSTGTGSASFEGASIASSTLTSAGDSTVQWVGASTAAAALGADGIATMVMVGASDASGAFSADGLGDALFVGDSDSPAAPAAPTTTVTEGFGGAAWGRPSSKKKRRAEDAELAQVLRALAPAFPWVRDLDDDDKVLELIRELAPEILGHFKRLH